MRPERGPLSLGWIMQPAFFDAPAGVAPGAAEAARRLIEVNEHQLELVRRAGFDTIWVEDHMAWGDRAHLECITNLSWLAGRHTGLRYGTMVCGQAFRNPAYLAKAGANLQLLTGGRFILGIGAGNNAAEHAAYGYPFGPAGERLDRTEECVRIIRALWRGAPASYSGRHHSIEGAVSLPLPEPPIPLMIGGGGERRTLRLVAEHADWWCSDVAPVEVFRRKRAVLGGHCQAVGRDQAEIVHAQVVWISVEDEPARVKRWEGTHIVAGGPEDVAAELREFRDAGVDHFQVRFLDHPSDAGLERFVERVLPRLV